MVKPEWIADSEALLPDAQPHRFPQLHCPSDSGTMVQIILYDRPNPTRMQYLSLKPIALALGDKSGSTVKAVPPFDSIEEEEDRERQRKLALVVKLKWHSVVKHTRTQKALAMRDQRLSRSLKMKDSSGSFQTKCSSSLEYLVG